ncbi:MFS transporter [Acidithiobacillus ferridurans]|uniref:MFS transporter n=1 Tax=Acidithiobacillus ferridurans TaxID=1232575 RepID=UPI001C0785C9|nr:MFS transporter [Acidithiobacillus ferridurans]MBU2804103.1 MFS transporter [Acidithiobacillus ferridurans]
MKSGKTRHRQTQHALPHPVHPDHASMTRILDESPLLPIHYRIWALSTGGTLLSGVSMFLLGVTLPLIIPIFAMPATSIGLAAAMLMGGTVVGALIGGHLADRLGRKPVMIMDMILLMIATLLTALAPDARILIGAELLVGVGIGMDFPVGSSYLAEFMPQGRRGRMMAASIAVQSIGMLVGAGFALVLLQDAHSGDNTWRWLLAAEALLVLPYLLGRLTLPESARWCMGRGHNAEAARILERIAPRQKAMLAAMAQRLGKKIHHVAKTRPGQRMGFWTLFSPEYRRRTLLVTLPWFFMDVATYGVGLFTTILLGTMRNGENVGIMNGVGRGLANALDSGKVDIFLLLGSLLSLWMVPWLGRIHMQMIGFGGMTLGMGLLYVATELAGGTAAHPQIILSGFMVFNLFMTAGPNATTFILPTEMYPTQVRAFSAGFAAAVAKIGATISVFLLPVIQSALGVTVILLLMGTVSLLGLVLTYHFRVQGRGLTLEEHHGPALPQ